jgi:hypothetical protein
MEEVEGFESAMTSTRARGDAFRDRVFGLLRMRPGIRNIVREKPVQHQAVDIYYEELASIGYMRIGCECKDYGAPLTRGVIEDKIYPKYNPLLANRELDAVRIITKLPVAVDVQRYVESIHFRLTTLDELESGIMDFASYLHSMDAQYADEGLDVYYRPAAFESSEDAGIQHGDDAEQVLTSWIEREGDARPLAILATYGMGKSSLARRLAWVQANRHLESSAARIPILIQLGDISTEQDIRGLVSKHFAAQNVVHNFHYDLFCELNRRGRFVLIFDGFDEMKHTMSFSDIRFNFSEINRLVEGRARVLLLGRPTIFRDDHERQYALHGLRENQLSVPDAANYIELGLCEFDEPRAAEMMKAYGEFAIERRTKRGNDCVSSKEFLARLASVEKDEEMATLSRRPVQAKMLVDLALEPQVEWRRFTRYEMYNEFVYQFLERETKKIARKRFAHEDRAKFQRELAWWMWITNHTSGFEIRALPRDLFAPYIQHADEAEGVARDLVSGAMLDQKSPDRYFFRHRSYLEFLVAQYVCTVQWTLAGLGALLDVLTDEVLEFIEECPRRASLDTMLALVDEIEKPVSKHFVELLGFHVARAMPGEKLDESASARRVFIHWAALRNMRGDEVIHDLALTARSLVNRESRIAAIAAMVITADRAVDLESPTRKSMLIPAIVTLLVDTQDEMQRVLDLHGRARVVLDPQAPSMWLLATGLRGMWKSSELILYFDSEALFDSVSDLLKDSVRLSEWGRVGLPLEPEISLAELGRVDVALSPTTALGAQVEKFFRRFPDPSILVPPRARVSLSRVLTRL